MAIPSDDHMLAFGKIIHHYASAEAGIKITLSGLLKIELARLLILTEPCSAMSLRNVAKSLVKGIWPEEDSKPREAFCQMVGDLGAFGPLRNSIGHSRWYDGTRPDSIKPAYVDIRSGTAKYFGVDEEERDWTVPELNAEADKLLKLNQRIAKFLVTSGALANIDAMALAKREEMEAREGMPSKDS
jgi:hypothetical protein